MHDKARAISRMMVCKGSYSRPVDIESVVSQPCMTGIYLHFRCAHYGFYVNAPVSQRAGGSSGGGAAAAAAVAALKEERRARENSRLMMMQALWQVGWFDILHRL